LVKLLWLKIFVFECWAFCLSIGGIYRFTIVYKAFQQVETLFIQGKNLVPSRLVIGKHDLFTFRQPIAGLLGTRFLPWTNKCGRRKVILLMFRSSIISGMARWSIMWPNYERNFLFPEFWNGTRFLFIFKKSKYCVLKDSNYLYFTKILRWLQINP